MGGDGVSIGRLPAVRGYYRGERRGNASEGGEWRYRNERCAGTTTQRDQLAVRARLSGRVCECADVAGESGRREPFRGGFSRRELAGGSAAVGKHGQAAGEQDQPGVGGRARSELRRRGFPECGYVLREPGGRRADDGKSGAGDAVRGEFAAGQPAAGGFVARGFARRKSGTSGVFAGHAGADRFVSGQAGGREHDRDAVQGNHTAGSGPLEDRFAGGRVPRGDPAPGAPGWRKPGRSGPAWGAGIGSGAGVLDKRLARRAVGCGREDRDRTVVRVGPCQEPSIGWSNSLSRGAVSPKRGTELNDSRVTRRKWGRWYAI